MINILWHCFKACLYLAIFATGVTFLFRKQIEENCKYILGNEEGSGGNLIKELLATFLVMFIPIYNIIFLVCLIVLSLSSKEDKIIQELKEAHSQK